MATDQEIERLRLEDEKWAAAEGIPKASDQFIQKYFQGVDALIDQENKHRSDLSFRELLSPIAKEACAIVSQIRFEEQETLWTTEYEDGLAKSAQQDIYPGMMYSLARNRIEDSKLFKIIQKMPKGALLHCHMEAMIDLEWLFEQALNTEGFHISAPNAIYNEQTRGDTLPTFKYFKSTPKQSSSDHIWSSSYQAGTWIPIQQAADAFPDGGKEGFMRYVIDRCSITPEESLKHHYGPNDVWAKFQSCFMVLNSVIYYEPTFRKFLRRLFTQLAADGVQWVDIRSAFAFKYYKSGSEEAEPDFLEFFDVFYEELESFQKTPEGKDFWGARVIWTTIRRFNDRSIVESMKQCIACKQEFPELIAGFDLVGHEDPGRPLADLVPILFWFRKTCAQSGVDIPFFFHAGETLGSGTDADMNLFDAVLLGTRRIGHGFSLYKHPLLMNMVRDRRILVECCPISNEVLRLTASISAHPLPALLAQGVPVSLSNDDPGILGQGSAGMSHDFWQALQGIENLGLEGLGSLAENSVKWAAFEDASTKDWTEEIRAGAYGKGVKAQRLKQWKTSWEKFCQWIVIEFGVDMPGTLEGLMEGIDEIEEELEEDVLSRGKGKGAAAAAAAAAGGTGTGSSAA